MTDRAFAGTAARVASCAMTIRRVRRGDLEAWHQLRLALWPDADQPGDRRDMEDYLTSTEKAAFVAEDADGRLVGFAEAGIRPYADGCDTPNVGYVEGWQVAESHRRQGIGAALVRAAEDWARAKGCREMASDCLLDNEVSRQAHVALGYQEVERAIHFAKRLEPRA